MPWKVFHAVFVLQTLKLPMTVPTTPTALPATATATRINRRKPDAQTMAIAHRVAGIEIRKEFTDSLKRFSDYVDEAGNASSGGPGIYIQLSRRMNAAFGLSRQIAEEFLGGGTLALRDNCTIMELLALQMLEIELKDRVDKGMAAGDPRDDIKKSLYACIDQYGLEFANRFTRWRVTGESVRRV